MRTRRGVVAILIGLTCLGLASCGKPDRLSQKELFSRVVDAELEAGSSHVIETLTASGGSKIRSEGDLRLGKGAGDTAMAMTITGGTGAIGPVEMRLVGQAFYIEIGALTQHKFVKIDLTDKSNLIARQYGDVLNNLDPARQLKQYQHAVTGFDSSGEIVEIDGVDTRPYKITIDPRKSTKLTAAAKRALPKSMTYTLWVGPDDLPRRMTSYVAAPGGTGQAKLRMDYSHWGDKVSIKAPNAAHITKNSLLNNLAGG